MTPEDRFEIPEAIARYSHVYDSKDADGFAALFTEDAVFEVIAPGDAMPLVRLASRSSIHAWAVARQQAHGTSQDRHYQSGILFERVTAETATVRAMLLLVKQAADNTLPVVHLTGAYHDTWRKPPDGWRLAHRVARVDRDPGYTKHGA
jgi:ketosteroid isomerase-like protein